MEKTYNQMMSPQMLITQRSMESHNGRHVHIECGWAKTSQEAWRSSSTKANRAVN